MKLNSVRLASAMTVFCLVGLLRQPAWPQSTSNRLTGLGQKLQAIRGFAEKVPDAHRKAFSGTAQNLIHAAEAWGTFGKALGNGLRGRGLSPASPTSSSLGNKNVVQVSDPSNDFAFSLQTGFTQSETSTAWCGKNVVVGFNDSGSIPQSLAVPGGVSIAGVARSGDQGHTFQDLGFLNPGPDPSGLIAGDPVIGCADQNTFYYASLFIPGFFPNIFTDVTVSKSINGGVTFGNPVVAISKPLIDPTTLQFLHLLDKEWMTVDTTNPNRIYVTYTDFDGSGSSVTCGPDFRNAIELVRSDDGGMTWTAPIIVDEACGFAPFVQGSQVAVGSGGQVYVAWEHGTDFFTRDIRFRKSMDNANTFGAVITVDNVTCVGDCFTLQGLFRSGLDFPSLAVDRSGTPTKGNIYIAWHDARNLQVPAFSISGFYGYADVLLSRSSDGGATWSPAVRVNDNPDPVPGGGGTDQYQPGAAVDGTGKIGVCFYDRRMDPQNYLIDRFCAFSTDAGASWKNLRQSSPSWAPTHATDFQIDPFYMGDYDTLASDFLQTTPGFIGAFQMFNSRGGISGNSIPVPNPDVFAAEF